jgi:type III pantothenate kinase
VKLLIDLGNTRLKWAFTLPGIWQAGATVHRGTDLVGVLDLAFGAKGAPAAIWVSSVAGEGARQTLTQWMQTHWGKRPYFIQAQAATLDVRNSYREPGQLGVDRWAALIAARQLVNGAACIVDCGTAVTIDALSADGVFLGGVIFPGLHLLRQSLVQGTAGLTQGAGGASVPRAPRLDPIVDEGGNVASCQARSTADAIRAGAYFGLCGAIQRVIAEHRAVLGADAKVVLTGGDADRVKEQLGMAVLHAPDLVLKGLDRMANEL